MTHLRIPDNVQQTNDIWTSCQILQNLDLPLDLLFLDWFQHLDYAFTIIEYVYPFEDFRILKITMNLEKGLAYATTKREREGERCTFPLPTLRTTS